MKVSRPVDLARQHGLSTQAIRNYEEHGYLPPAERSASGYRRYTEQHAAALRAYLALIPAHGYPVANTVMRSVHAGEVDMALRALDRSHAQLLRDRETLDAVEAAVTGLTGTIPAGTVPAAGGTVPATTGSARAASAVDPGRRVPISVVAHRLGVRPATLRKWERAGILTPQRDAATRYRVYGPADIRDAELAHLLRRGGHRLDRIAEVVRQVREAGGTEALTASLQDWRLRLTGRSRTMLTAASHLDAYLQSRC